MMFESHRCGRTDEDPRNALHGLSPRLYPGNVRPFLCSSGANLQRSCDSISPYGKPPLICGRPFKEAVAAPSLLTGLGLDSSKRLLCSLQSQRGRGAPPSSKQLPPLETRVRAQASQKANFNG